MAGSNHEDGGGSDAGGSIHKGSSSKGARKERTSVCSFCGMTFNKKEHLQRHERTHTLARPYQCEFEGCGKAFARRDTLTRHTRLHQREELQGTLKTSLLNALGDEDDMTDEYTTPSGSKQPSPTSSATALAPVATPSATASSATKGKKATKSAVNALKSSRRGSSTKSNAGSSLPSSKKTTPEGKAASEERGESGAAAGAARTSTRPRRAAVATASYDESAFMDEDLSPEDDEADVQEDQIHNVAQDMDMDSASVDIKPIIRAESAIDSRKSVERTDDSIKPLLPALHTSSFLARSLEAHHAMAQGKPALKASNAQQQQPIYNFASWGPHSTDGQTLAGGFPGAHQGHPQGVAAPTQQQQQTGLTATVNGNTALLGYSSSANSSTSSSGSTFASAGTNSVHSQASPYSFSGSPLAGSGNGISALGLDLGLPPSPALNTQHNSSSDGRQYFQSFSFSGSAPPGSQQHYRQQPYQQQSSQSFYAQQPQSQQQQSYSTHERSQSQPFGVKFQIFQSPSSAFNNNFKLPPIAGAAAAAADTAAGNGNGIPLAGSFDASAAHTIANANAPAAAAATTAALSPTSAFFGLNGSYPGGPAPAGPPGSQGYPNQSPSTAAQSFLAGGASSSYSPQLSPCESLSGRYHSIPLPDVRPAPTLRTASATPQSFVPGMWSHMSVSMPAQMQSHMQMPMQRSYELMQAHQAHHRHLSTRSFSTSDEFELVSNYSSVGSPDSGNSLLATSPTLAAAVHLPYTATSPGSETSTLPSLSSSFSSAFSGDYLTSSSLTSEEPMLNARLDDPLAAAFKYKSSSMQPLTIVDPSSTSLSKAPMDMGLMLKAADAHTDQFINWPDREPSPLTFSGFSPETPFGSSVNTAASPSTASYLDLNDYDMAQSAFFADKTFTMSMDFDRTAMAKVSDEEAGRQSPIASLEDWLNKQTSASDFIF